MPSQLRDWIEERLKDTEFRTEYMKVDLRHQIAAEITRWRIKRGYTQTELADGANVTKALVSRTENARSSPTIESIQAIAYALRARARIQFVEHVEDRFPWTIIGEYELSSNLLDQLWSEYGITPSWEPHSIEVELEVEGHA